MPRNRRVPPSDEVAAEWLRGERGASGIHPLSGSIMTAPGAGQDNEEEN